MLRQQVKFIKKMHLGIILKDKAGLQPCTAQKPYLEAFFFNTHLHLDLFACFFLKYFISGPHPLQGYQEANFIYINIHMKIVTYKKKKKNKAAS